jgi:hypothetical protein
MVSRQTHSPLLIPPELKKDFTMTQPTLLQDAIAPEDMDAFVDDLETIAEKLDLIYKARRRREIEEEQRATSDLLKTWNCLKALY